jgi:LSU ribosomal protein L13P
MGMRVIDASNLIMGRLCSYVAKQLLTSEEEIVIVNAEKVMITGRKESILERFKTERDVGSVRKGPRFPKEPDRILRRTVRGMLPMKTSRGKNAFKRLRVYVSIPEEFKNSKIEVLEELKNKHINNVISLLEVSRQLGSKVKVNDNSN